MKKATFILLFMMGILSLINAESSALMNKQFRDSIFQTAKSEPNDTLRLQILREAFQQYLMVSEVTFGNDEIALVQKLEAYELVEAYEKGKLKGKLKEIAAGLNEESNPVLMLIKYKK